MKKTLSTFFLLILSITSYGQIDKYEKKYDLEKKSNYYLATNKKNAQNKLILDSDGIELKSFDNKKTFFIDLTSSGKLIYATKQIGFNDGGGFVPTELSGLVIEDLVNNTTQTPNYNYYYSKKSENLELYFVKSGNYIGAIDKDGNIVIDFKYRFINPFNKSLESIAYTDNEYFVIDTKGKEKYGIKFKHNENFFGGNYVNIDDQKIVGSKDGVNYGYYDFANEKEIIPFKYSSINLIKNNHAVLINNGVAELYNIETKETLLPTSINAAYIFDFIIVDGVYYVGAYRQKNDLGQNELFIYSQGKDLTSEINYLKSIEKFSYPLVVGTQMNRDKFVLDLRTNRVLMRDIPKIDFPTAEFLEGGEKYIIIGGKYNQSMPEKMKHISLLIDSKPKMLTPFLSQARYKVIERENGNDFVIVNHVLPNSTVLSVYLNNKALIKDVERAKVTNERNEKNQIEITQNINIEVPHPHPAVKRKELSPRIIRIFIDENGEVTKTEPTIN
ncbi:WG repeat-containing protein [Flavobacterium agricola]|uniref:WG repeat-containing protein n=1 Tax=Flavobacterium agricola TaxID=2870839 RepID=A0ABY6LZM0_9FLAO|nr:WG repeat-containing protein [Flavobacterium agricola]UYW01759.1 WG repeat-containing protein [Flavobacterium agricola]